MPHRLRAGIIGTGFIGSVHARAVRAAGAQLACVADATAGNAAAAAQRMGGELGVGSAEELIAMPDIDVVHICTPNWLHASLAEAALSQGKHVICEKPLATTVSDARAVTDAAIRRGLVATVPFIYRYYPMVREVRARVLAGDAGSLGLIHGSYLQDWLAEETDTNWRVDPSLGGASRAFGDIGVHWCDLIEYVTDQRITRLSARLITAHATRETEDGAIVAFETDRSTAGSVVVSQVALGRKNRLSFSIDGAEAAYMFDQESPDSLWIGGRTENRIRLRDPATLSEEAARYSYLPAGHPQGYQDCFNAFVADTYSAIDGQRVPGLPRFADGLRAAKITEAVVESATKETWVEVMA
jgi:predicted dehydrogenase